MKWLIFAKITLLFGASNVINHTQSWIPKNSLENTLFSMLYEFTKEKKMFFTLPRAYVDYKPPKLHKGTTSWYISYYVKHPDTDKFRLFRIKVNHFGGPRERLKAAKAIMAHLQEKLSLGWNPLLESTSLAGNVSFFDILDTFLSVKGRELEGQTFVQYRSYIKIFRDWLTLKGFTDKTMMGAFTTITAKQYMSYLEGKKKLCPRTYNNHLTFQRNLFGWIIEKGWLSINPYKDIKRKPKRLMKKKRQMLSTEELHRLFTWCAANNKEYLALCLMCYCCFMRPKEIALLKCGDIDIQRQVVRVRADHSSVAMTAIYVGRRQEASEELRKSQIIPK